MTDLQLKKRYASLYKPSAKAPSLVAIPPLRFLMLDGEADIGGPTYQQAVQALYGLAYPVKFAAKKRLELTYSVMPLEGLYWHPSGEQSIAEGRHDLAWRLMIMLPDEVSAEFVDEVREAVAKKKDLPRLADVRVQTFTEGESVQMLHIGPYAEETSTIERLYAFAADKGLRTTGLHHEIYLSDPQKAAPAKLRTILRYGVSR